MRAVLVSLLLTVWVAVTSVSASQRDILQRSRRGGNVAGGGDAPAIRSRQVSRKEILARASRPRQVSQVSPLPVRDCGSVLPGTAFKVLTSGSTYWSLWRATSSPPGATIDQQDRATTFQLGNDCTLRPTRNTALRATLPDTATGDLVGFAPDGQRVPITCSVSSANILTCQDDRGRNTFRATSVQNFNPAGLYESTSSTGSALTMRVQLGGADNSPCNFPVGTPFSIATTYAGSSGNTYIGTVASKPLVNQAYAGETYVLDFNCNVRMVPVQTGDFIIGDVGTGEGTSLSFANYGTFPNGATSVRCTGTAASTLSCTAGTSGQFTSLRYDPSTFNLQLYQPTSIAGGPAVTLTVAI